MPKPKPKPKRKPKTKKCDILGRSCADVQAIVLDFLDSDDHGELAVTCKLNHERVLQHFDQRYEDVPSDDRLLYGFNKDKWLPAGKLIKQLLIKPIPQKTIGRKNYTFYQLGHALRAAIARHGSLDRVADAHRAARALQRKERSQSALITYLFALNKEDILRPWSRFILFLRKKFLLDAAAVNEVLRFRCFAGNLNSLV